MFKITYKGKGGWEKGRKGLKLTFCEKYGLSKVNETAKNCIFCWQCAAGQSGHTGGPVWIHAAGKHPSLCPVLSGQDGQGGGYGIRGTEIKENRYEIKDTNPWDTETH